MPFHINTKRAAAYIMGLCTRISLSARVMKLVGKGLLLRLLANHRRASVATERKMPADDSSPASDPRCRMVAAALNAWFQVGIDGVSTRLQPIEREEERHIVANFIGSNVRDSGVALNEKGFPVRDAVCSRSVQPSIWWQARRTIIGAYLLRALLGKIADKL